MHLKLKKGTPQWERRLTTYNQLCHTLDYCTLPCDLSRLATNYKFSGIWSMPFRANDLISVACLYQQSKKKAWHFNDNEMPEYSDQRFYQELYAAIRDGLCLDDGLLNLDSDPVLQELIERRVAAIDLISVPTEGLIVDRHLQDSGQEDLAYRLDTVRGIQNSTCEVLFKAIVNLDQLICERLGWPTSNLMSSDTLRKRYDVAHAAE